MFIAGKFIWIVVQPLSLACVAIVLSFLALVMGWRKSAVFLSFFAGVILFTTLFTSIGAWGLQKLEARFPRPDPPKTLSCMIILGGAFDLEVTAGRGGMEMNQAADRFIEAARLARLYPLAKIVVSGGDGSFSGTYKGDAELAGDYFAAMGVDPARIIQETSSRNTIENVAETKALLDANGLENCLLITSAYHLPRATSLFAKEGVTIIPWPSDYRASGKIEFGLDFTQPSLNAALTSTAMREWAALLNAYLQGKSETLIP